jgi:hypothetical protein
VRKDPAGLIQKLRIGDRGRSLVRSLGEPNPFPVPKIEAEESEYRQRGRSKRLVVEALGKLERCACVLLCRFQPLRKASPTGEPAMNHRL